MKVKTQDLIDAPLDWAVAKALGLKECLVTGRGTVKDVGFLLPIKRGHIAMLLRPVHDKWYAKCEDYPWRKGQVVWEPSTSGSEVIEIMEREKIDVEFRKQSFGDGIPHWYASHPKNEGGLIRYHGQGPTLRIAVCRCFIASKLGDEVDIPEELL